MADSFSELRQQLRALRLGEDQVPKSPAETTAVPEAQQHSNLEHPQEDLPEDEWLHFLPSDLTNEARMHYWMLEQARLDYEHNHFPSCHARCAELLSFANLPKYAYILTLHLMSGVVPIYLGQHMLQDALESCDMLEQEQGKNETIDLLRGKTEALLRADLEELNRSREEAEEPQDVFEGEKDGEIFVEDDDDDVMMVDELVG